MIVGEETKRRIPLKALGGKAFKKLITDYPLFQMEGMIF